MSTNKVAISIDKDVLEKLDRLVRKKIFPSRSNAPSRKPWRRSWRSSSIAGLPENARS